MQNFIQKFAYLIQYVVVLLKFQYKQLSMFAISEQEKLNAYYENYTNLKYNFAKKRRELGLSQDMTSILSGVSKGTISRLEGTISETQDVRLSTIIDICLLFKISIQDMFEMRPPIDSEETALIAKLLTKQGVSPSELPEDLQNDFANYIGAEKYVNRDIFASWHRIYAIKNHGEKKEELPFTLAKKIKELPVGESHNYKTKHHSQMYWLVKSLKGTTYKLRNISPELNSCTRIS
jgi:DNA-binding XRE family transcriptional regulator